MSNLTLFFTLLVQNRSIEDIARWPGTNDAANVEMDFITGFPRVHVPTLWSPDLERDSCGVALLAHVGGQPSHSIVKDGLTALGRMAHRGAKGSDGAEDGVGIMLAIPDQFFRSSCVLASMEREGDDPCALPPQGRYAVGMMFLSPHEDEQNRAKRQVRECVMADHRLNFLGWRRVPVNDSVLGNTQAAQHAPSVWQFFVATACTSDSAEFKRILYSIAKQIEALGRDQDISHVELSKSTHPRQLNGP